MTTFAPGVRLGAQQPRVSNVPATVVTTEAGVEACELADSVGVHLDPWQRHVMLSMLGERQDGKWAAFETGLLVARQNGKGEILLALGLSSLFLLEDKLCLHSAHEFKTAAEAFLRLKAVIDGSNDLRKQVRTIRTSHGEEGVELLNGKRLRFVARSKSSGRGFTVHRVILDEAQELPRRAVAALMPTLSAAPNPQIIYTGTVPEERNDSAQWESVRDRGRAGDDPYLAWLEWSPPGSDLLDIDVADRENWWLSNPAQGIRIPQEYVEREFRTMASEDFARERLSVWPRDASRLGGVFDYAHWQTLVDRDSRPIGPMHFALEVSDDREWSCIGMAAGRADGLVHCDVVENHRGTAWIVEVAILLSQRHPNMPFIVDPSSQAGSLIGELEDANVQVTQITTREVAQACGLFFDLEHASALRHLGQPMLDTAVIGAKKKPSADAYRWDRRRPNVDISPLVAVTLAAWHYKTFGNFDLSGSVW